VDFLSVGSNDLLQFMFAADRLHPRLAGRYDSLSPAALKAFATIRKRCVAHNTQLTLCGEMAANPLDALALISLGYRSLSMSPTSVGPVKQMLMHLDAGKASAFVRDHIEDGVDSLRDALVQFARQNQIPL
jgi:phosphotransferase system enzyme I (PtsP)